MNVSQADFNAAQSHSFVIPLTEGETRQISINYSAVLSSSVNISNTTWTCEQAGLTVGNDTVSGKSATVRISGAPGRYNLVNTITTSGGETIIRVVRVVIKAVEPLQDDYTSYPAYQ